MSLTSVARNLVSSAALWERLSNVVLPGRGGANGRSFTYLSPGRIVGMS